MCSLEELRDYLAALRQRAAAGDFLQGCLAEQEAELMAMFHPRGTVRDRLEGATVGPSECGGEAMHTRPPALVELDLKVGTVLFDQWQIRRELGRGGFGVVFEAEDKYLGERQAIKILDPTLMVREDLLNRFRREVRVMRGLRHRHIVRVFDYREDIPKFLAMISMELVPAGSVATLLARAPGRSLRPLLALTILQQTLAALEAAHAAGVIHRDVSPGNVLLAGADAAALLENRRVDPDVRLVDFGIASMSEPSELSRKSRALGTASYLAPEVLAPDGHVTPAVDVYSAGAMAYELLTGRTPAVTGYRRLDRLRAGLVPELTDLIMGMVAAMPSERLSLPEAKAGLCMLLEADPSAAAIDVAQAQLPLVTDERAHTPIEADAGPIGSGSLSSDRGGNSGLPYWLEPFDWVEVSKSPRSTRLLSRMAVRGAIAIIAWALWMNGWRLPAVWTFARLKVQSNVTGDSVAIDGRTLGETPVARWLEAGKHEVVVTKLGCDTYRAVIVLEPRQSTTRRVELRCRGGDGDDSRKARAEGDGNGDADQRLPAYEVGDRKEPSGTMALPAADGVHVTWAFQGKARVTGSNFRLGAEVTTPRPIFTPEPEYPDDARLARDQGVIQLSVLINSRGTISSVAVEKRKIAILARAAEDAVRRWKFEPPVRDGREVDVMQDIEFSFELK